VRFEVLANLQERHFRKGGQHHDHDGWLQRWAWIAARRKGTQLCGAWDRSGVERPHNVLSKLDLTSHKVGRGVFENALKNVFPFAVR